MPCMIKFLTPDGLLPASYSAESLAEAARHESHDGVYTITNTYNIFRVLKLDAHLNRLEDSAQRENIPLQLDRPRLRAALRQMIAESGYGSVRFRISIARAEPDTLILTIEPFKPSPPEVYEQGVRCVTTPGAARHNPAAKTADWLHDRVSVEQALPAGIYTGLLLTRSGDILEGLSSNFYAVLDSELRTAGSGVLGGIAQQVVFEVAPPILAVRKEAVNVADVPRFSEAFITSSSRGIVPVVEIDGVTIDDGKPGAKTLVLRRAYAGWVEKHLEEL